MFFISLEVFFYLTFHSKVPTWYTLDKFREFFRKVVIYRCMHKMSN